MDFDITKVTIDGTVDDLDEDQLRELVSKFQDAQESNVAEFKQAIEATEDVDEKEIEDFEKARESLIGDITDAEAFDEVPLTEDALEGQSFGELRDWKDFVAEQAVEDGGDEDADFDDMGKKSPVGGGEDEETDFVEEELDNIQGLNI